MITEKILDSQKFKAYLEEQDLSASSINLYYSAIKRFLLNANNLDDIEEYNQFLFEHTIKKRSNYYYEAMKWLIKFRVNGVVQRQKMIHSLQKPKKHDPHITRRVLDGPTRQQIIDNLKEKKHQIIAKIQENTGARAGDVLKLKKGNINYEDYEGKIVLRIDFTGKGQRNYVKWVFNPGLQQDLEDFIKNNLVDTEYYFLDRTKNPRGSSLNTTILTNYHAYWVDLKQALEKVGVNHKDWATHDWRRNFARTVWNETKDPLILKDAMNHTDFNVTLGYLRNSGLSTKELAKNLDERSHD